MRFGGRRQRGQALSELALLSLFLIVILIGAVDLTRVFQFDTALQEAAREGARHAAWYDGGTNPFLDNTDIKATVATVLKGAGITDTIVPGTACPADGGAAPAVGTVNLYTCLPSASSACPSAPAGSGQDVDVAVIMQFSLASQFSLGGYAPTFPIVGDAHMRVQGC